MLRCSFRFHLTDYLVFAPILICISLLLSPLIISSHLSSLFSAEEPEVRTRKIVKVVTQTMVNGKVVDESSEVEQIEESKK